MYFAFLIKNICTYQKKAVPLHQNYKIYVLNLVNIFMIIDNSQK